MIVSLARVTDTSVTWAGVGFAAIVERQRSTIPSLVREGGDKDNGDVRCLRHAHCLSEVSAVAVGCCGACGCVNALVHRDTERQRGGRGVEGESHTVTHSHRGEGGGGRVTERDLAAG